MVLLPRYSAEDRRRGPYLPDPLLSSLGLPPDRRISIRVVCVVASEVLELRRAFYFFNRFSFSSVNE